MGLRCIMVVLLAGVIASLLCPSGYLTPYVYSAVASFGMVVVDFRFPSQEGRAFATYRRLARVLSRPGCHS